MKRKLLILLIVSALLGAEEFNFLKIDEIKEGDKGFGLTSFIGSKIDTFYVEILSILKGTGTGQDIILAKLSGDKIEKTGVIAGMSGSPVFINGKLIGAVAYAWSFSKEPICGITPVEDMFKMTSKSLFENIVPIKGILTLSGVSRNEFIDSIANKLSLEIVPGGISKKDIKLTPGAPCGILLAYGDAIVSVFGTLTFVKDGFVYAFGHPAFSGGNVKMPFALGEVNAVLPSFYNSFKISSPASISGAVVYDGPNGIIAKLNENADVIECNIRFSNLKRKYYITKEDFIFKSILASLLFSNLIEYFGNNFEGSITGLTKFYLKNNDTLIYSNYSYDNAERILTLDIYEYLNYLSSNNVSKLEITKIDIDVSGNSIIKEYKIKDIVLNKNEYKPDEKVYMKIILEKYRDKDTTIHIELNAPSNEGNYYIYTGSEREIYFNTENVPINRKEIIKFLKNIPSFDILSVNIIKEDEVFKNGRQTMNTTKKLIFKEEISSRGIVICKKKIKMDGNLSGNKTKQIKVRR